MRFFILAVFMMFAFAPLARAQDKPECSIEIIFGSYGKGIDLDYYEDVRDMLEDAREVATYTDTMWGKEGERRLCVTAHSMQATDKLYDEITRYMPNVSSKWWVEIIHEDGRSHKTQWPQ